MDKKKILKITQLKLWGRMQKLVFLLQVENSLQLGILFLTTALFSLFISVFLFFFFLILSTIFFFYFYSKQREKGNWQIRELYPRSIEPFKKSKAYQDYEYRLVSGQPCLLSSYLAPILDQRDISLTRLQGAFKPPRKIKEYVTFLINSNFKKEKTKIIFNYPKVRLLTDLTQKAIYNQPIIVQKTDYYSSLVTNEATLKEVMQDKEPIYNGSSLLKTLDNEIIDYKESFMSNHIGISSLGITKDKKLVFTLEGNLSLVSPNRWRPSGSGSVEWRDAKRETSFNRLLKSAMERELDEELGLKGVEIETFLIGFSRFLHRGGKPEFFGVSFLEMHSEETQGGDIFMVENEKLDFEDAEDLYCEIKKILEEATDAFSVSLHINLYYLKLWLENIDNKKKLDKHVSTSVKTNPLIPNSLINKN